MDDESIMKVSSSIHSVDDRGGTDEGASEQARRTSKFSSGARAGETRERRGEERLC